MRAACDFTGCSFDLKIKDFNGKNYRLFKNNLDKEIVPGESKVIVKKNRITIKMCKAKGKYKQEGKTYVVNDGDVIFFKFNVTAKKK